MRDLYAQRKNVYARRGQYTASPSWTALCPHRRHRPTHIAVGTNLNSPAHMDALRETIGAADDASTLPVGLERTARRVQGRVAVQSVRSGPSGSEGMGSGYARGRVAVHLTLPLGVERTVLVRSGASGSATLDLGGSLEVPGEAPGEALRKAPGEVLSFRLTTKAGPAFCETCLP